MLINMLKCFVVCWRRRGRGGWSGLRKPFHSIY